MDIQTQTRQKIYTVSQINAMVKQALDANLPSRLIVRGELSGCKRHHSGHCYFSLKDDGAVLPCVMWASNFTRVRFKLEDGMAVLATGNVGVWTVGGRYQFYAEKLEPEGKGALQLAFEQMVRKLEAEGLFAEAHKKPIPKYPSRIGILTSESGAAVHDIADSIHNRWPGTRLLLYPVSVQGPGAAESIAAAIADVNRRNGRLALDLLIVGRGGGSQEDLWAFNEEVVARAIFASQIPIISAVGHEVDVTVADMVADARASTPTKAGVVAVPDVTETLSELAHQERRLTAGVQGRLDLGREYLRTILASAVFRNPLLPVLERAQQLDEAAWGLADATKVVLTRAQTLLHTYQEQVGRIEPHRLLGRWGVSLGDMYTRMRMAMYRLVNDRCSRLAAVEERIARTSPERTVERMAVRLSELESRSLAAVRQRLHDDEIAITAMENRLAGLNPKSILHRGYSITRHRRTGEVVRDADQLGPDDVLVTELADRQFVESRVTEKRRG